MQRARTPPGEARAERHDLTLTTELPRFRAPTPDQSPRCQRTLIVADVILRAAKRADFGIKHACGLGSPDEERERKK